MAAVRRYRIGRLDWAAPMDSMCEPFVLAKTGLSVEAHQRQTVANYQRLKELALDLPFISVLQGWILEDYLRCVELYRDAGVDLAAERLVGVGSVCRRQATDEIGGIMRDHAGSVGSRSATAWLRGQDRRVEAIRAESCFGRLDGPAL